MDKYGNDVTLQIYSSGTTPIYDVAGDLLRAQDLWYETFFPTGMYGAAAVFIPKKPSDWWQVKGPLRTVIRNGQKLVYEGKIPNLQDMLAESEQGVMINIQGMWAFDISTKNWRKRWADDRTDEGTWPWFKLAAGADKCFIDRRERFKFVPKAEAWTSAEYASVIYTMPYGETVARVVYDGTLAEGAQSWEISLYRSPDASTWTQMNAGSGETFNVGSTTVINTSTTTSIDVEPAAGTRYLQFRFFARANQTPTSDGSYYAAIEDLVVYSEDEGAGDITLKSICEDIAAEFSDWLSATTQLHTPSTERGIEPFITSSDSPEPLTSIMIRAAAGGDGDGNNMSVGLLSSESVASPDGKPVLYTSEYPSLTDGTFDYYIHPDDKNLVGRLVMTKDYEAVINYIPVSYRNKDGITKHLDPAEHATLQDTDSIAEYGRREWPGGMALGNQTQNTALEIGAKRLSDLKDAKWKSATITVNGYILDDQGQHIPAAQIAACDGTGTGHRIKVDGYDTFIISRVRNSLEPDGSMLATIYIGEIAPVAFSEQSWAPEFDDSVISSVGDDSGSSSGGGGADLAERLGLTWLKKSDNARYKQIKRAVQRYAAKHGVNAKTALRKLGYGHLSKF